MNQDSVTSREILKVADGNSYSASDELAIEQPLEIQLSYSKADGPRNTRKISVTMRTPGHDAELGVGFLFTEGILRSAEDIAGAITTPEDNTVRIPLKAGLEPDLQHTERNFYTTSSCGVCGKSSIDAIKTVSVFQDNGESLHIAAATLYALPAKLREQQEIFESTGGLHASALFDTSGNFITLREDVGRHNALDKVIGAALLAGDLPLRRSILLLSGRASFELVQKAHMAGINVIAAVGAPSSLAAELAEESNITLIGFLRGARFNIYTHAHRVIMPDVLPKEMMTQ